MLVEPVQDYDDLYLVDTHFLGHEGHVGCYIIDDAPVTIIDQGASTGVDRLLRALDELGISRDEVGYLMPTHVHLDHAGGTGYLAEVCENATVVCHERGKPYLSDPEKIDKLVSSAHRALGDLAEEYGDIKPTDPGRLRTVRDGEIISLADRNLRAVEATGHAPHQMCWFDSKTKGIFVGDEAGMWMHDQFLPATPPPNFDYERIIESLDTFANLEPDCLFYPHFGIHPDPKEGLNRYRNVLEQWIDDVRDAWKKLGDEDAVREKMIGRDSLYYDIWDEKSARQTLETDTTGVLVYLKQTN